MTKPSSGAKRALRRRRLIEPFASPSCARTAAPIRMLQPVVRTAPTIGLQWTLNAAKLPRLYRFLESERFAQDLVEGKVWITTLEACRKAEGADRRDAHEGTLTHHIDRLRGDEPNFAAAVSQTGAFKFQEGARFGISGITLERAPVHCYVLCWTERFEPDRMEQGFGKWCVELERPIDFFGHTSHAILSAKGATNGSFAQVSYQGRVVRDNEVAGVPIVFLKPEDGYTHQREVRMAWACGDGHAYEPFMLDCPEVRGHCRIVRRPP